MGKHRMPISPMLSIFILIKGFSHFKTDYEEESIETIIFTKSGYRSRYDGCCDDTPEFCQFFYTRLHSV